jgi:hypothetical protein
VEGKDEMRVLPQKMRYNNIYSEKQSTTPAIEKKNAS